MDNRGGDSVGFFVYFQDSLTSFDVFFKYFLKVPLRSINYKHYKWYIESDQIIPLRFVVNFVGIGGSSLVTGPEVDLLRPVTVKMRLSYLLNVRFPFNFRAKGGGGQKRA